MANRAASSRQPTNRGRRGGTRKLRIIGGQWRGRQLQFADNPAIRPTPDRVRETLFNWLQPSIHAANCLDLFAGSGALGLEALSRGASRVDFVEQDRRTAATLRDHLQRLQAEGGQVQCVDAFRFLRQQVLSRYQLIFLDPPFANGLLERVVEQLEQAELSPQLQLYIEVEQQLESPLLPSGWAVTRSGSAGQVRYLLAQKQEH